MPRALVIGGSVGGLMAGNLLRKAGWDVVIFERTRGDLATRGAGLGISQELVEVLQRCGARFDATGGVSNRAYVWMNGDGSIAFRHARESIASAWQRVYKPLREATPSEIYRQGKNLLRVEQDGVSVTARFEDGSRECADLLIAADGVYSTVRAQFLPDVKPRYANYVAWRGIAEERDLPQSARDSIAGRVVNCFPEGEHLLTMAVPGVDEDIRPGHRRFYAIWYRPARGAKLQRMFTDASGKHHGITIPPPLIQQSFIEEVRRDASERLPSEAAAVIRASPQLLLQAISDMESPQLVFGRVAILGDAAFIARPHSAAGVSKAGLDALCLADELASHSGDIDAALASYNLQRLRFGKSLVGHARYLGAYLEGRDAIRDPAKIIREYGAPHLLHDVPLPDETHDSACLAPPGAR